MGKLLEKEFQFYLDHQAELVKQHDGRVLVIKECHVIGDYSDEGTALEETLKKHEKGTFLIQRCTLGEKAYTRKFKIRLRKIA